MPAKLGLGRGRRHEQCGGLLPHKSRWRSMPRAACARPSRKWRASGGRRAARRSRSTSAPRACCASASNAASRRRCSLRPTPTIRSVWPLPAGGRRRWFSRATRLCALAQPEYRRQHAQPPRHVAPQRRPARHFHAEGRSLGRLRLGVVPAADALRPGAYGPRWTPRRSSSRAGRRRRSPRPDAASMRG